MLASSPGHTQPFQFMHENSGRAWHQKSCDRRHGHIMKSQFETRAALGYPFTPGVYLCLFGSLESTMIVLQHFIYYKALPYTCSCCEQQHPESCWLFCPPTLNFHPSTTCHMVTYMYMYWMRLPIPGPPSVLMHMLKELGVAWGQG